MSEDIYAKPDLTKKVRFQQNEGGNREESDKNIKDYVDGAKIYDNYWAEGNSSPKVEDNTTDDHQQINSVSLNSEKRHHVKTAFLLIGLMCCLLLVTVIVLASILIVSLWAERDLQTELQERYRDLERLNHSLTQRNRLLEDEKANLTIDRDQLQAINTNLTEETEELHKQLHKILLCPKGEWRFSNSWYFISKSVKDWTDSKEVCQELNATLAIISTEEEQRFISSLNKHLWIGLTDQKKEGVWKWVNGDEVNTTYWKVQDGQPDNHLKKEHCAEIQGNVNILKNWNDQSCSRKLLFICEKTP